MKQDLKNLNKSEEKEEALKCRTMDIMSNLY
jgi:hypothetical protein